MRVLTLLATAIFIWSTGCGGVLKQNNEEKREDSGVSSGKVYGSGEQENPNPFSPIAGINFTLEKEDSVKVVVYDIDGNSKGVILNSLLKPGKHSIEVNTENLVSGIYFVRITTSDGSIVKKITVLK
ncbi:MAG: T9SS type A sorting domain-containing protein [Candidatus Zixiibacteriota bacterium]|nr:MAG: T9SS type A sorting domain-containing protein [candidate division Zixibacteria bacterium]